MNSTAKPGQPKFHPGWFATEEAAIRHLKATFDDPAAYRKAFIAYVTLLRIANLEGQDNFSRRIAQLAEDMGYAYSEAARALKLVELAGLCTITPRTIPGSNERESSLYLVKRMSSDFQATSVEKQLRLPDGEDFEESPRVSNNLPKNSPNNLPKNVRAASPRTARFVAPSMEECRFEAEAVGLPGSEGDAFFDYHTSRGWIVGKSPMRDWRAAMRTWRRTYEQRFPTRNGQQRDGKTKSAPDYAAAERLSKTRAQNAKDCAAEGITVPILRAVS